MISSRMLASKFDCSSIREFYYALLLGVLNYLGDLGGKINKTIRYSTARIARPGDSQKGGKYAGMFEKGSTSGLSLMPSA